ncbi:hypothetical protein BpHYR1_020165 [Brachionus plicatilis]|uniref:Uncharacterized protein n=1 Tax=Brachionus plicatilis TaxID=10195 RepID=A0A3M7QR04_BRAPC|nr:hypothetical protein BpHYR1_020165 [Brachionus plicatilis]
MKKISIQFVVFVSLRVERSKNQINTYFCWQIERKNKFFQKQLLDMSCQRSIILMHFDIVMLIN